MSKEKQTEEQNGKVVTRYDRRTEKRKKEEEKERRSWLRFRIISSVILAAIAVAIIFSLATSFYDRYQVLNQTYFKVGEHNVTRLEYNYYFNNSYNNYLSMYGSYASIMGLDTATPLDEQTYPGNENMTWKDYFDQAAVTQLQQVKAIACVNETLDYHPDTAVGEEWLERVFDCPIDLVGHGTLPHRVLGKHKH